MEPTDETLNELRAITPSDTLITPTVLRRLREGDHDSFQKVYIHWRKPIYSFVYRLVGGEIEADDITQDIFVSLWHYREKIDPDKNIRSLLFFVAKRAVYNNIRSKQIRKKYAESLWFEEKDLFTSHDFVVEKETEMLKMAMLEAMPTQQRVIFEMAHEKGMSAEEIAHELGIKRETVYSKLSKARKEIREALLILLIVFAGPISNDSIREILDSLIK